MVHISHHARGIQMDSLNKTGENGEISEKEAEHAVGGIAGLRLSAAGSQPTRGIEVSRPSEADTLLGAIMRSSTASVGGEGIAISRPEPPMEVVAEAAESPLTIRGTEEGTSSAAPQIGERSGNPTPNKWRKVRGPKCYAKLAAAKEKARREARKKLNADNRNINEPERGTSPSPTHSKDDTTPGPSSSRTLAADGADKTKEGDEDCVIVPFSPDEENNASRRSASQWPALSLPRRGRPSITGEHVDKAKAQKALNEKIARTRKMDVDIQLSRSIAEIYSRIDRTQISDVGEGEDNTTAGLTKLAGLLMERVDQVAGKSGNIKGDMVKVLKDSAKAVMEIVGTLAGRSANEEVLAMRAANQRLQEEVKALRKEMEELRVNVAPQKIGGNSTTPQPAKTGHANSRSTRSSRSNAPTVQREEGEMEVEVARTSLATLASQESPSRRLNTEPTDGVEMTTMRSGNPPHGCTGGGYPEKSGSHAGSPPEHHHEETPPRGEDSPPAGRQSWWGERDVTLRIIPPPKRCDC